MGRGSGGKEEVSNVFSVKFSLGSGVRCRCCRCCRCCRRLKRAPLRIDSFSNTKALRGTPSTENADGVSFFSRKLSNTSVERVVSVMNDARGMSPVRAEVFISSY